MKEKLQERLLRAVDDVTSAKFFVLASSTMLLAMGKLGENNWVMLAMMVAGLKEAGNIAYTWKSGQRVEQTQKPDPTPKEADNADPK
jgi:hypothetical protein